MPKNSIVKTWLFENSWNILTVLAAVIIAGAYLNARVTTNAHAIAEVQEMVEKYPSEDYFNLKFENIDEDIKNLTEKVDNLGGVI